MHSALLTLSNPETAQSVKIGHEWLPWTISDHVPE